MTTEHITRENILAMVESVGCEMAIKAQPNYWRHEDHDRAVPYGRKAEACRDAYRLILAELRRYLGGDGNAINILIEAIRGTYATTGEELVKGGHKSWVTYGGDLYHVYRGDKLNSAAVQRVANMNLPEARRVLEGAAAMAAMVPNPNERIRQATQAR
jgi:hypothetical protein